MIFGRAKERCAKSAEVIMLKICIANTQCLQWVGPDLTVHNNIITK